MIFSFIGMPLSGKSTLAKESSIRMNLPLFSTGEFARTCGMGLEDSIKTKDLSMDFNENIIDAVLAFISNNETCIVDGFPRSLEQVKISLAYDFKIIYVDSNPLDIWQRALNRNRDQNDSFDVVMGRCDAAVDLKHYIQEYYVDLKIIMSDDSLEDIIESVIKYMRWCISA